MAERMATDTLVIGLDFATAHDITEILNVCIHNKYAFASVPIVHPRFRRHYVCGDGVKGGFTRSDMILCTNDWAGRIVAKLSPYLDVDSDNDFVRARHEDCLMEELTYSRGLSVSAIMMPLRKSGCINLARVLQDFILQSHSTPLIWMKVPMVADTNERMVKALMSGETDSTAYDEPWHWWSTFHRLMNWERKVFVALELSADIPPQHVIDRWLGEPVKCLIVNSSLFRANKKGFPILGKAHQDVIRSFVEREAQIIVSGAQRFDPHHVAQFINYMWDSRTKASCDPMWAYAKGWEDYIQTPLQPLADNLESSTYNVFEKDPVKYDQYQKAIAAALIELRNRGQNPEIIDPLTEKKKLDSDNIIDSTSLEHKEISLENKLLNTGEELVEKAGEHDLIKSEDGNSSKKSKKNKAKRAKEDKKLTEEPTNDENSGDIICNGSLTTDNTSTNSDDITPLVSDKPSNVQSIGDSDVKSIDDNDVNCVSDSVVKVSYEVPVVMVLGAGRGPLIRAALNAASITKSKIEVVAVEKNPCAVVALAAQVREVWKDRVTLLWGDMRRVRPSKQAHIIVSELLGSWGDNELSPECLDGASSLLRPDGLSIPVSYSSYCSPVMSSRLWNAARAAGQPPTPHGLTTQEKGLETVWVVFMRSKYDIGGVKPVFTFTHPSRGVVDAQGSPALDGAGRPLVDNRRCCRLSWTAAQDSVMHGFGGYFDSQLFGDEWISIVPDTHSPGMISWFPAFIPIRTPLEVKGGSEITATFWRCVDSRRVWYEWTVSTGEQTTPLHNPNGRSFQMLL